MAQQILLRRSNLSGKTPTTASMYVGELAINTYDGKVFLYKSGSAQSIEQVVTTNAQITGSIFVLGSGSFGEINVSNDVNVTGSIFVQKDIVVAMDIDVIGNITGSTISASHFVGDGSGLTGVAISAANNFDFNQGVASGYANYIEDLNDNYIVTATSQSVTIVNVPTSTTVASFSTSSVQLLGIGDVLSFSSSIATQFTQLRASASLFDAGTF
jgi:hypothetical protein